VTAATTLVKHTVCLLSALEGELHKWDLRFLPRFNWTLTRAAGRSPPSDRFRLVDGVNYPFMRPGGAHKRAPAEGPRTRQWPPPRPGTGRTAGPTSCPGPPPTRPTQPLPRPERPGTRSGSAGRGGGRRSGPGPEGPPGTPRPVTPRRATGT